jgi:hypothetical protein
MTMGRAILSLAMVLVLAGGGALDNFADGMSTRAGMELSVAKPFVGALTLSTSKPSIRTEG